MTSPKTLPPSVTFQFTFGKGNTICSLSNSKKIGNQQNIITFEVKRKESSSVKTSSRFASLPFRLKICLFLCILLSFGIAYCYLKSFFKADKSS